MYIFVSYLWVYTLSEMTKQRINIVGPIIYGISEEMYISRSVHPCEKVIGIFFRHKFFNICFL